MCQALFFVLIEGCKDHCDVEKRDYCPLKSKGPFVYVTKELLQSYLSMMVLQNT